MAAPFAQPLGQNQAGITNAQQVLRLSGQFEFNG